MNEGDGAISRRQWWVLLIILAVAAAVRVWRLGDLPPAMFRDEAEKALNGWFLLNRGVDAAGRPWPLFIKVFGVTTSAIYQYATLPFLALGGLNVWTARLPAATAGVLAVLFTWLACRRVWGWQTAAWAAGFLALSPWHVPLSRWAQQGVFLPMLFVMGAWGLAVFVDWDGRKSGQDDGDDGGAAVAGAGWRGGIGLLITAACVAVAMYAYDPARLFGPLLALAAAAVWWRVWLRRWRWVLGALAVFGIFVSPVAWLMINHGAEAQARFRFLSIYREGMFPGEIITAFLGNYASHFSPEFLLISGDRELRHSGGVGMLNVVVFVFAIVGAGFSVWRRHRWGWFLILWIALSPVAASLTRVGVPHALRSQVALPAWQMLAAVGVMEVVGCFAAGRRKVAQQLVFLAALAGALPFLWSYFGSYSRRAAANWQFGVKESLEYLSNPMTADSHVVFRYVTGAEYLVPFYLKMDRDRFVAMEAGMTRFEFEPAAVRDSVLPVDLQRKPVTTGPIAWVAPPGVPAPGGTVAIPIHPDNADVGAPPVMVMYLNGELVGKVEGNRESGIGNYEL